MDEQPIAAADDLDELKTRLTAPTTSRRSLLKGAGVAAGGLAALGALGAAAASPAGATPGPDVPYFGAPSLALFLKANGQDINGDNTAQGQEGSIECFYFEQKANQAFNAASGRASGKRSYTPIVIRKPVDSSTPLLHKALALGQACDGTVKFFRPNADGLFNFYSVSWKAGRIVGIDDWSPDNRAVVSGGDGSGEPYEEVSFTFGSITWQFGDSSFTDSPSAKV